VHKKVCGEASNPFTWPLLTKEENRQIWELWDVPPYREYKEDPPLPTVNERFTEMWGLDRKDFKVRFLPSSQVPCLALHLSLPVPLFPDSPSFLPFSLLSPFFFRMNRLSRP
jgi:hypothetical protein